MIDSCFWRRTSTSCWSVNGSALVNLLLSPCSVTHGCSLSGNAFWTSARRSSRCRLSAEVSSQGQPPLVLWFEGRCQVKLIQPNKQLKIWYIYSKTAVFKLGNCKLNQWNYRCFCRQVAHVLFCLILVTRKRYVRMRQSLVRFRSLVHMYVNRKQYIKVREHVLRGSFSTLLLWKEFEKFSVRVPWSVCRWSWKPRGELQRRGGRGRWWDESLDWMFVGCLSKRRWILSFFCLARICWAKRESKCCDSFRSWTRGRWWTSHTW